MIEAHPPTTASGDGGSSSPEAVPSASTSSLFSRVSSIPVVTSALSTAQSLYSSTKGVHPVVQRSLETIEGQLTTISTHAAPLLSKHLEPIDRFGCQQLDSLETRFPVIKEPTTELIAQGRQVVAKAIEGSQKTIVKSMDSAVERFLPEEEEEAIAMEDLGAGAHADAEDDEEGASSATEEETEQMGVWGLTSKIQARLRQRALKQLEGVRQRRETTAALQYASLIVVYARENMERAAMVAQSRTMESSTALTAAVAAAADAAVTARNTAVAAAAHMPQHVAQRLAPLTDAIQLSLNDLYAALANSNNNSSIDHTGGVSGSGSLVQRTQARLDVLVAACVASVARLSVAMKGVVRGDGVAVAEENTSVCVTEEEDGETATTEDATREMDALLVTLKAEGAPEDEDEEEMYEDDVPYAVHGVEHDEEDVSDLE